MVMFRPAPSGQRLCSPVIGLGASSPGCLAMQGPIQGAAPNGHDPSTFLDR